MQLALYLILLVSKEFSYNKHEVFTTIIHTLTERDGEEV